MRRSLTVVVPCLALAGCSLGGGASKSGGVPVKPASSTDVITLRFATANPTPVQAVFFSELQRASGGRVRVKNITYDKDATDVDVTLARDLARGKVDVAEIGARAWESLGVRSMRALQSPFLITSEALLDDALHDRRITAPLLASLSQVRVTGLALVPGGVRYIFSRKRPLVSPQDFKGARIRINVSPTTSEILRALGARVNTSVRNVGGVQQALAAGRIDGVEADVRTALVNGYLPLAPYAGAPLFSKATTIAANSARLKALGSEAAGWIREAAEKTAAAGRDADLRTTWKGACGAGMKPVSPTPEQLDALHAATEDVDAALDGDPGSAVAIDRIGLLATRAPAHDPWARCGGRAPRESSPLDGTYAFKYSAAELASMGSEPGNDGAYRVQFGHGRFAIMHLGTSDPTWPGWDFQRDPVEVGSLLVHGGVAVLRPQTSIGVGSRTRTLHYELFRDRLTWTRAKPGDDVLFIARPWRRTG